MATKTLPPTGPQAEFHPYIPAQTSVREFTPRALIVGTLLGVVFGASSLYLVLKVGITVSASIPVAVILVTLFPLRRALIVAQHGQLKYPEGTACAEVLKAGARDERASSPQPSPPEEERERSAGGLSGKAIFAGLGIGLVYKTLMSALKLWKDTP